MKDYPSNKQEKRERKNMCYPDYDHCTTHLFKFAITKFALYTVTKPTLQLLLVNIPSYVR